MRTARAAIGLVICSALAAPALAGQPSGACCLPAGACVEVTEGECLLVGGAFQARTACSDVLCAPACAGDVNGDGTVGFPDLLIVLSDWGPLFPCPPFIPADVDRSCAVDDADLAIVLDAWGPCVFGACCLDVGACVEVDADVCADLDGVYRGNGSFCELVFCVETDLPLGPPREWLTAGEPITEAAADVDGDGFRDVVVLIGAGAGPGALGDIQLCSNQGNNAKSWVGFIVEPAIGTGMAPGGVLLAPLDGGNLSPDVGVCNAGDDTLHIFLNDGRGTFGEPLVLAPDELDVPVAIASADFTGDGRFDLVVANVGNDTVLLLEAAGPPLQGGVMFIPRQMVSVPDDPSVLCPEDVDNDRDIDLVAGARNGAKAAMIVNGGTGLGGDVFLPPFFLPLGAEPVDLAGGDLDGNGFVDVVSANRSDDTITIIFNEDGRTFDTSLAPIPVGDMPRSVEVADLDGDGDLDIAVIADDPVLGPALVVIENVQTPGGIAFALPVAKSVMADPNFVLARDLNNDGRSDLITVNGDDGPSGGSVTVLLQVPPLPACAADIDDDGQVGFHDLLILLSSWGPCPVCPADVNGDGTVGAVDLAIMVESWGPC